MMQTLEMSLNPLIRDGVIARDEAAIRSLYPQELVHV
jgi:hypothetical protein